METYRYSIQVVRTFASLIAALYINLHGYWNQLGKAFSSPLFYIALSVSFFISYLIMYFIHLINSRLDRKFRMQHERFWGLMLQFLIRLLFQILAGIALPALIIVVLILFYFQLVELDFDKSYYMLNDFPIVVLFLLLLNGYYLGSAIANAGRKSPKKTEPEMLVIHHNGAFIRLNPVSDILYFYKDARVIKTYTISGKEYTLKGNISSLRENFSPVGFCQVNPSAVVNLNAIKGYATGTKSKTLIVLFKVEYHTIMNNRDMQILRVTREYIPNFKKEVENLIVR